MYGNPQIPDEEYQTLLFEWCQPIVARTCREAGLPYPELDDTGHLKDPQAFTALYNETKSNLRKEKQRRIEASVSKDAEEAVNQP